MFRRKKATYPALYGLDETSKLAENVFSQACRELEKIDKETSLLNEIAGFYIKSREVIFFEFFSLKSV